MTDAGRQMNLALSVASLGYHVACWRLPGAPAGGTMQFSHYVHLAGLAERGKFDMMFLADVMAAREVTDDQAVARRIHHAVRHDPLILLAALAATTSRVGLVATASTTYNEPFGLARRLASIDHISGGRMGWNVVTGYNIEEAQNHGYDRVPDSATRYGRAYETLDVVKGLWDSWDDDAFIHDKESGIYFDPARMHVLDHRKKYFSVRGPLDVARSPQGYPVVVTAGESEGSQELAARAAEVLYASLPDFSSAQAYYRSVKSRLPKYGRAPGDLKILTAIMATVGETEAEAREKFDCLRRLIHPDIGLRLIVPMFGDLSAYPLDEPVPLHIIDDGPRTDYNDFAKRDTITEHLAERIRAERLTVRQLYEAIAEGYWQLGIVGTPRMIVDRMEEWFTTFACDGFVVQPPYTPGAVEDFVSLVIPELQRRGLFRKEYAGTTLRDHLGIARASSQYRGGAAP